MAEARRQQASKRIEQGDATRNALLDAARTLFGDHGYDATTLQAVVAAAGVTKGAFYHHFHGKEELFLRVYEQVKRELDRAAFVVHLKGDEAATSSWPARQGIKPLDTQSNDAVWQELLDRCRRFMELHTDPRVQRIALIDARSVLSWETWHEVERNHGIVLLRADLRRAMVRGILRPLPLQPLATMVSGALHEACMEIANADDPEHPDRALTEAMEVLERLLSGLRADAPER